MQAPCHNEPSAKSPQSDYSTGRITGKKFFDAEFFAALLRKAVNLLFIFARLCEAGRGCAMTDDSREEETPEKSRRAAAVALKKYGIEEGALPKVVAAGYGKLAEQIVEIAFQNGVKVREDKDLAQMLAAIEIDSDIPSEVLVAIAEILAYVYKANGTYQSSKNQHKDGPEDDNRTDA